MREMLGMSSWGRPRWLLPILAVGALCCLAATAQQALAKKPVPEISVVGNRADLVSGGDALVEIEWPGVADAAAANFFRRSKFFLNGRPLTGVFMRRPDDRYMGLVTGLNVGENELVVTVAGDGAKLKITNRPLGGPVFAGAQQQPWICATMTARPVTVTVPGTALSGTATTRVSGLASDPLDDQCNAVSQYSYYYQPKAREGSTTCTFTITGANRCFEPFPSLNDPASRPADSEIADFTNDRGQTAKSIIRVERGAIDRGIYQLVTFFDPAVASAPWLPQPGWNQKLLWVNGGGTGASRFQTAPGSSVFNNDALRRGYMVAASQFTEHGTQSNITLGAELMTMLKERIAETYGPIRFTMGFGCSGGAQIQTATASAYPGLFDGIQVTCSFPDSASTETEVADCSILSRNYYNSSNGSALSVEKRTAINGNLPGFCNTYLFFDAAVGNPARSANCGNGFPAEVTYDKLLRPNGVRCSEFDHNAPQVGTFTDTDGIVKGNRPVDNEGVQYGLKALHDGAITVEEFVQLNEGFGGYDNEWVHTPGKRMRATDVNALQTWYRAGLVSDGRQLAKTPIIDLRGQNNLNGDVHENWRAWQTRARLDRDYGSHANQLIWAHTSNGGSAPSGAIVTKSFLTMDQWLTNLEADTSAQPRERKVVTNKPAGATDMCITTNGVSEPFVDVGLDSPACPVKYFATPRIVAGEPLTRAIFKCQVKPLDFSAPDYGGAAFDAGQQARLRAVFTTGVCDWTKPGVGQVPGVPWMTFKNGPGGEPLGPEPVSSPLNVDVAVSSPPNVDVAPTVSSGVARDHTGPDRTLPRLRLLSPKRQSLARLRSRGLLFRIGVDEAATLRVTISGRFTSRLQRRARASARGKLVRLARISGVKTPAGVVAVTAKPSAAIVRRLRREKRLPALLTVKATDGAGNSSTRTKVLTFR